MADTAEKVTEYPPLIQPLPWRWSVRGNSGMASVYDSNGFMVFGEVTRDEAELIVKAVNRHEEVLTALDTAADHIAIYGSKSVADYLRALIAEVSR